MKRPIALACVAALGAILATTSGANSFRIMPDGSGDFPDIQTALVTCVPGDSILVAPGVFHEQIIWPVTDGLVLLGETTPEECILDGEDAYRPITINHPVGETTVIKGLTIQHGFGGGIMCSGGASPVIEDNVFYGNDAHDGGGIYCYEASPTIRGNIISECSADDGGGICCVEASPTISGNTIHDCTAEAGGGIRCKSGSAALIVDNDIFANTSTGAGGGGIAVGPDASVTISDNWIHDNDSTWGGGIGVTGGCDVTITDNRIEGNIADSGGGMLVWGNPTPITGLVARNEIRGNMSPSAGGIRLRYSLDLEVRNNLIVGNISTTAVGGVSLSDVGNVTILRGNLILENVGAGHGGIDVDDGASPLIESNLIHNNQGYGIYCSDGGNPLVVTNDIHGHGNAYGVLNVDPMVTVMAENNWWGDNSGPRHASNPSGTGDWVSDFVDFDPWSVVADGDTPDVAADPVLHQNKPNPFNPRTVIAFTVADDRHIRLSVHAVDGRLLATLRDGRAMAGRHEVVWRGEDGAGRPLPSGVYFYRLTSGELSETKRMVLVR